jgi:6-phosphogluconolactonase
MKRHNVLLYLLLLSGLIFSGCNGKIRLFAGGFTQGNEKGFFVFDFNERNGNIVPVTESDAGPNPSYFCFSQDRGIIYSLNEVMDFKGSQGGGVTTLRYDPNTGSSEKLNEITVPFGGPCHISLSADKNFLFLANYSSGSVAVLRLDDEGIPQSVCDTIKYYAELPEESHPHMIMEDPSARHVYVTDLGLDRIMIYDFDSSSGKLNLSENGIVNLPKGSGPRHFVFNSDGSKMYLINELGSTIMVYNPDGNEGLKLVQVISTVRKEYEGRNFCAAIQLGKSGEFLYGSNRGENTIVSFRIANDGTLSLAGHVSCSDWPRSFVIDPSGRFLLVGNQRSEIITVFKISRRSGIPEGPVSSAVMKAPAYLEFWK